MIRRVSVFRRITFVCLVFNACRYNLEFFDVWNGVFRTLCVKKSIWFDWKRKQNVRLEYLDIVFSQSNVDQMIPTPVVIRNYRTATSTPNRNGEKTSNIVFPFRSKTFGFLDEESQWVYHRRFFLFDRLSGFSDNRKNFGVFSSIVRRIFVLELKNVHYAKSIKFLTRLVGGTSYIQPPILIIDYDELSQSDLNQEKVVSVKFWRKKFIRTKIFKMIFFLRFRSPVNFKWI